MSEGVTARRDGHVLAFTLQRGKVDGCSAVAGNRHVGDMATPRDREIVAELNALRQARLSLS